MTSTSLERRIILITGGGSGIGRALAIQAAEMGAKVILTGRGRDALEKTGALMSRAPELIAPADITSNSDRRRLEDDIRRRYGRLDILVNNAGMGWNGALQNMSDSTIESVITTNLTAPIQFVSCFLPLLEAAAPGSRIVNVGSMFGDIAYPLFAVYSASKFGLRGFSDAMRRELAGRNIEVTYVAPRATRTPAMDNFKNLVEPFGMQVDTVETVARHVMMGILKGRRTIYPQGAERLFTLIHAFLPRLIDRVIQDRLRTLAQASLSQK